MSPTASSRSPEDQERRNREGYPNGCRFIPAEHLNILREAGLVTTRAEGQSRIQALNPAGFVDLETWLQETRSVWSRRLDALERELRAEDAAGARPSRKNKS